jgi:hypothetical protein
MELNEDTVDHLSQIINKMQGANFFQLLIENFDHFDELDPEESEAIFNSISILDNIIDLMPSISPFVC